jgi:hypothetical protein
MSKSPAILRRLRVAGLALFLCLAFGLAANAENGSFLTASNTLGATAAIDSAGSYVYVHVWRSDASAASTSVAYLQVSTDNVAWYRAATFTNVTGLDGTTGDGGDAVSVPSWPFMRIYVVSCSSGRLTARWGKR